MPAGKTWPAPKTPVVIDQKGCQYSPHVMGIMVGQPYRILNSDGVLHNIHALPKVNPRSTWRCRPPSRRPAPRSPSRRAVFTIKCDVHPWMSAYVGVFTHPFFSVTAHRRQVHDRRTSTAGTYEIEAWHEKLGTQTASVTVGASDTKTADFKFAAARGEVAPPGASRDA